MFRNFAVASSLVLALTAVSASHANAQSRKYTGRVTARTDTTISIYDKEIITVALDGQTIVEPWVREKPFARKPVTLPPSAVIVGALVTVRTREDRGIAEVIQVANDVKRWFNGRIVAFTDRTLSVFDRQMAVVTLAFDDRTSFRQLFTVKPWVRKPVRLAPTDLKIGALVEVFPSKADARLAARVEIATTEKLVVPLYPAPKPAN